MPNSGSVVCTDYEAWIPEFGNPDYNPRWYWPIDPAAIRLDQDRDEILDSLAKYLARISGAGY